jgi:hypothetical protein
MTDAQGDPLRAGILQGVSYFALIAVGFVALLFAAWKWDTTRTNETLQLSEDALVLDIRAQLPPGTPRGRREVPDRARHARAGISMGRRRSCSHGRHPWATWSIVVGWCCTSGWTARAGLWGIRMSRDAVPI